MITTVGLVVGYNCNIRCRHCLWGDTLDNKTIMTVEDAYHYIDNAMGLGTIKLVGFAGGEPFLSKGVVRKAMYYAGKKYGVPSAISTNSSWAKSSAKAKSILKQYFDVGLRRIQISVDDFHQEWVPLESVRNSIVAATELGIKCTLICVVTENTRSLKEYLDELSIKDGSLIEIGEARCTRVGFASEKIPESDFKKCKGVPSDHCSLLNVMNILPDGSVQMCCGAPFSMRQLCVGNAKESNIKEIVDKAQWNPVFTSLANAQGPEQLVEVLSRIGMDDFIRYDQYSTSCEACQDILRRNDVVEALQKELDNEKEELFVEYCVRKQLGG